MCVLTINCLLQLITLPSLFKFPVHTSCRRVIFTHRAIHSRLTTGGVTVSRSTVLFFLLSLSLSPILFFVAVPFREMQVVFLTRGVRTSHVAERWSFLSRAGGTGWQPQGRSLRVFQIVVLHDGQLPIAVLVSPASPVSERSARRGEKGRRTSM